jgi:hypothetical protein
MKKFNARKEYLNKFDKAKKLQDSPAYMNKSTYIDLEGNLVEMDDDCILKELEEKFLKKYVTCVPVKLKNKSK